jgi:hypothetical protein
MKHERSASVSSPCFDSAHNKIPCITGIIIIHAATSQHMGCYQECQQHHNKHLPQRIRPFRLWSSGMWQQAIAQTGFTTLNKPHASTFRIIQEHEDKRSTRMLLSTYQITQDQTSEDCNLNIWCNQIVSKLHLLLHCNNRYFLISTVSFKIVSLGHYKEIAPHSQHSIRCTVRNSASLSHRFSCIMVISSNLLPLKTILGFGKIKKECSTKIL